MAITQKQITKFWARLDYTKGECWLWKDSADEKGFGNIRFNGRHTRSHRAAFEIFSGKKLKPNIAVKHTCENRLCCNPQHLYVSKNGNDSAIWESNFWKRVKVGGLDECWPWVGKSKHHWGYGLVRDKWTPENGRGRMRGSHAISHLLTRGETGGLQVLHHCDNPPCCNPIHLFLGTQLENVQDMIVKRRDVRRKGNEKKNAKVTNSIVRLVRRIYKPYHRQFSAGALARKYGISESNMHNIITGKAWKHIG